MGKIKDYIKRGIKYIVKEHKQPVVKVEIVQKTPLEEFKNKTFIITGGGSGIGFYIAKKIVEEKRKCYNYR